MARAAQRTKKRPTPRASDVKERLLVAGEATLREQGFFEASARGVAERAGVAVGGIHYHFDSVEDLLLQAFERTNARRLAEYEAMADAAQGFPELLAGSAAFFEQDRLDGRFRMLAEMMASAATGGAFAAAVADHTEPWVELAERAVQRFAGDKPFGVLDARDVAVGVVALFLGLELLGEIDAARFDTTGFLERTSQVAAILAVALTGPVDAS